MGAGFFMHPWHGISFTERKEKRAQMRDWLRVSGQKKLKRGQIRDDGKVFCGYGVGYTNGEQWCDPKVLDKKRKSTTAEYYRKRYNLREDVRQKAKIRHKLWAQKYPDRINQRAAKRRALKRSLNHCGHDDAVERALHEEAKRMTANTGIEHHVDHIIPIKHGGFHHHQNLQVLPAHVNLSKSSTPFWTSETYKDFRSVPQWLWPEQLVDFYLAMRSV